MEISDLPNREFKLTIIKISPRSGEHCINKVRISIKREKIPKSTKQKL